MAPLAVPALRPGQPPISVLVDYDGTISRVDVSERLIEEFCPGDWREDDRQYTAGRIGSRTFFERQMPSFRGRRSELVARAASLPHDETFAPFVRRARELDVPVEVVSDGLGFFIAPVLRRLGVPDIPVATARMAFGAGRASMTFPNGHPDCFVCGTCKRNRVLAHRATGRAVVFVGDGATDRYAAAHADLVFAKKALVAMSSDAGWPFLTWSRFEEITAWLEAAVDGWRREPASALRPRPHRLLCGPEVWGPGRTDPPPNEPVRDRVEPLDA